LSGDIGQDDINTDGNFIAETTDEIVGENAYHVVEAFLMDSMTLPGWTVLLSLPEWRITSSSLKMWRWDVTLLEQPITHQSHFRGNLGKLGGGIFTNYSNPKLTISCYFWE
jgi:hypothetical protein